MITEKKLEQLPCPTIFKDDIGTLWRVHEKIQELQGVINRPHNPYYLLFECDENGKYDPNCDYAEEFSLNEINQYLTAIR